MTFDKFTKKGSLKDFKKHDNYYVAGPVGEFYEVLVLLAKSAAPS